MKKETLEFNGNLYQRFPDSLHRHLQRYYWPTRTGRKKGLKALHCEIWKAVHGPIPEDCLIHHRDENWLNNDIDNLACVTRKQHAKLHPEGSPEWLLAHLDRIRAKAMEWHRSAEGREWHREHGKRSWEGRQPVRKRCVYCHQWFDSMQARQNVRFCSRRCTQRWCLAYGNAGMDRQCEICGAAFRTSKYRPARTCGHKCGAAWRQQGAK